MNVLEQAYLGNMNVGGLGAMKRSYGRTEEKDEAERLGQAAANATTSGDDKVDAKLRGVAEEFVSVFMNQVMKAMRTTVQENPEMHGDNGEKFFQDLLDTEYAGSLSKGSGYGLTDLVYQSLLTKVRVADPAGSAAGADLDASAGVEL